MLPLLDIILNPDEPGFKRELVRAARKLKSDTVPNALNDTVPSALTDTVPSAANDTITAAQAAANSCADAVTLQGQTADLTSVTLAICLLMVVIGICVIIAALMRKRRANL